MVTRYTVAVDGRPLVAGTLALVVPQGLAIATKGQAVTISDRSGQAATTTATKAVEQAPPTELFPPYDPSTRPEWFDRAADIIAQL